MRDVFSLDEKLGFGKHSNRTYWQVAQMYPSYFCWMVRENVIRYCGPDQAKFKNVLDIAKVDVAANESNRDRHFSRRGSRDMDIDPDDPREQWAREETMGMGDS